MNFRLQYVYTILNLESNYLLCSTLQTHFNTQLLKNTNQHNNI